MKILFACLLSIVSPALRLLAQHYLPSEPEKWKKQAESVSIIRDNWDIPHIYGKTDADVVFGLMYAQCEDDFDRVEQNYLTACGRMAEAMGPEYQFQDLRQLLFLDTLQAKKMYPLCPESLKKLLDAFADGMNYYLYMHPDLKPRLLTRFEPWMPLLFSEGSIGGDISSVSLKRLKGLYGNDTDTGLRLEQEQEKQLLTGSNGFAVAPKRTTAGNALLLINPHTSFYFRTEVHLVSEEGLNAYGAITWGQFFVYQGFNEQCGWMHTSSSVDVIDEYTETIVKKGDALFYKYGATEKPFKSQTISILVKKGDVTERRDFTVYYSHHGPAIGKEANGNMTTVKMMNEPVKALTQSYSRIKSAGYDAFLKNMDLKTNSSNNTVYADSKGNIAYWQGNFMPKRNVKHDWTKAVDGSDVTTEWLGLHQPNDLVFLKNPESGWIQNCNSTPYQVAGKSSPLAKNYPAYMGKDHQNYRAVNAIRLLSRDSSLDLDKLIGIAYDPYLPAFEKLLPSLLAAGKAKFKEPTETDQQLQQTMILLTAWNRSYSETSVAATIAMLWGEKIVQLARTRIPAGKELDDLQLMEFTIDNTSAEEKITLLKATLAELERNFGTNKVAWGQMNRFQRITGKINEQFDDQKPSLPVASASSLWGSLASYGAERFPGTKKRYGFHGNSFVAVVEFGPRIKAKTVVNGGHSSNPDSPHFMDQAELFCKGQFKDVWFYKEDVVKHAARIYMPGK